MPSVREATDRIYQMMNSRDFAGLDDIMAANLVDHEQIPGIQSSGAQRFRDFTAMMHAAVSDLKITPVDVIVAADRSVVRATVSGRHTGDQLGFPATGKPFSVEVIDIMRFEGGRCVEHWGIMDQMGLMAQLGLLPAA